DLTTRIRRGVDVDVVVASEQLGDLAGREILPGAVRGSPVSQEAGQDVVYDAAVDAALPAVDVRAGDRAAQSFHGDEVVEVVAGQSEDRGSLRRGRHRGPFLGAGQVSREMRLRERRAACE